VKKKKILAIIKKPSDLIEVNSIVSYYKIDKATIYIINFKSVPFEKFKAYCLNKIKNNVKYIIIKKISLIELNKINLIKFSIGFDIVALPIYQYSIFYKNISKLRSLKIKTILISDGLPEAFGIFKYILAKNNIFSFLFYKFLIYFIYINNIADECFYTLYPIKNNFSRKSFPILDNFKPDAKITKLLLKYKINNLILSRDFNDIKYFKDKYKLKNYCSVMRTNKNVILIINDKTIHCKNLIVAEEIINIDIIKNIYSNIGTTVFYAKIRKINVFLNLKKIDIFNPYWFYFAKRKFFNL